MCLRAWGFESPLPHCSDAMNIKTIAIGALALLIGAIGAIIEGFQYVWGGIKKITLGRR